MAKSSIPRKAYHPKSRKQGMESSVADRMRQFYRDFEYSVYEHLPKGEATKEQLFGVQDMFRMVYVSTVVRSSVQNREEVKEIIRQAEIACNDVSWRERHICTGDELKAITEATALCAPYVMESIEACPRTLLNEWEASRRLAKAMSIVSNATDSVIKRIYRRV